MNDGDTVFEVVVRHNAVQAIRRVPRAQDMHIPESNLEVTSELARNHQRHGCIDGCYWFDQPERARSFAVLALDFVKRMLESVSSRLKRWTRERSLRRPSTRGPNDSRHRARSFPESPRSCLPRERGRPARLKTGGPAAHLRAGRPRSREATTWRWWEATTSVPPTFVTDLQSTGERPGAWKRRDAQRFSNRASSCAPTP